MDRLFRELAWFIYTLNQKLASVIRRFHSHVSVYLSDDTPTKFPKLYFFCRIKRFLREKNTIKYQDFLIHTWSTIVNVMIIFSFGKRRSTEWIFLFLELFLNLRYLNPSWLYYNMIPDDLKNGQERSTLSEKKRKVHQAKLHQTSVPERLEETHSGTKVQSQEQNKDDEIKKNFKRSQGFSIILERHGFVLQLKRKLTKPLPPSLSNWRLRSAPRRPPKVVSHKGGDMLQCLIEIVVTKHRQRQKMTYIDHRLTWS